MNKTFVSDAISVKLFETSVYPGKCAPCGRMSDIEAQIKTSFSQSIRFGSSVSILQRGVSPLAAFAFEKAVIADHQHLKGDPFFTFFERNRFRESLTIPAEVQIWIAALRGRGPYRLFFARHTEFDVRIIIGPFQSYLLSLIRPGILLSR
jgi:hypothetical protein